MGISPESTGTWPEFAVSSKVYSARQGVIGSNFLGPIRTVSGLEIRLRSLAEEILSNPAVADRHEQLANQLAESEQLNQQEIEAIIDPATLPGYSSRLEAIRREFNINENV